MRRGILTAELRAPGSTETAATVADLLREARDCLAAAGDGDGDGDGVDGDGDDAIDARVDAEVLLSHAAGLPVATQVAAAGRRVPAAPAAAFRALVARRAGGEPVAYLTGRKAFWSLELTVTPAVLIPRPETELLVETALAFAAGRRGSRRFRALELGTGSGAAALALARELPDAAITATDSSAAALQVARANYRRLRAAAGAAARTAAGDSARTVAGATARSAVGDSAPPGLGAVEFRLGDWFNALPASSRFDPPSRSRFDLIVCNPPYIAPGDPHLQRGDLRFEPRAALVSANHGLADLEKIIASAPPHLNPGGMLLLEHAHTQAAAVREMFSRHRFTVIATHHDLAGHARVTGGT
ncbi:MAG: peptide chain release factor N(5)-glutamine methyltransferase [Gammaproteobacteria bacterium]|nr:peptide chain release factor N(5)-glutamine methyltransferase [Gammaproteobacteria bacterium]